MKRKLLTQIFNDRRSNIWLVLELFIVSVVVWYIADFFYVKASIYLEPNGWNTERVYSVDISFIPLESPDFIQSEQNNSYYDNLNEIVRRLRTNPDIEYAALAGSGATPYDDNWSSFSLMDGEPLPGDTLNLSGLHFDNPDIAPDVSPTGRRINRNIYYAEIGRDVLKIFDIHGLAGETPEELEEILMRGDVLISATAVNGTKRDPLSLRGHKFYRTGNSDQILRVGAVIPYLNSLGDYSGTGDNVKVISMSDRGNRIIVKVKPGHEDGFVDRLMEQSDTYYRVDNTVIDKATSYGDIRKEYNREVKLEMRNWIICLGFMLISIFLGVFGTFWFRSQQRMGEFAIRKAFGASDIDIFRRIISEGIILLIFATIPAVVVDVVLARHELNNDIYLVYFSPGRMAVTAIATFIFMAMMIVLGSFFPALRSMKVEPARALADE